jgi:uncharacterized membrane protein
MEFDAHRVARGLGWFSIALGSVEVLAPGALGRVIGLRGSALSRTVIRVCGLREIAAGVGILATPRPAGWMTSRVAGDVMDLALLGAALALPSSGLGRLLAAVASVGGVLTLDAESAQNLAGQAGSQSGWGHFRKRVTVNRPADELYRYWRDFSNHPRFMQRVESVRVLDERRSHWVARAPGGLRVEWDSEVTDERPYGRIAWKSLPGSLIKSAGVVRFDVAPGDRGTEVTVELEYAPPGGAVTAQLLKLVGQAPEQQLQEDLRRFKQHMETGQIIVSEGVLPGVGHQADEAGDHADRRRGVRSMLRGGVQ